MIKKSFKIVTDTKARVILPNTLTLIGVCIGLTSINFALNENYKLSIVAILIAAIIIYVRISPIIVTLSGYLVLTGINLVIMDRPSGFSPDWMQGWGYGTNILSPIFFILVLILIFC